MAGEPQGLCFFPGINQVLKGTINVLRGITPSVCVIEMPPQASLIAEAGPLVFQFGSTQIVWTECKVDWATLRVSADGFRWQVSILDRRWRWRFGKISGQYNVWRDDFSLYDGKVDPNQANQQERVIDTTRTPEELAKLCFEAIGETNYDASALPSEPRPEVDWDGDNPAQALAELCEQLGCYIVLRQYDDKIVIVRADEGAQLPTDGVMNPTYTMDAAETPTKIGVLCGPTRYQVDFELEAVALDVPEVKDLSPGQIYEPSHNLLKLLSDLSYAPNPDPFENEPGFLLGDLYGFYNVANDGIGYADDVSGLRELAVKSVYRYYRIKLPVTVPGYSEEITSLEQLVLETEQVSVWWMQWELLNLPAVVYGMWWDDSTEYKNSADKVKPAPMFAMKKPPGTRDVHYKRPFQIDTANHLVIFGEPVYRNMEDTSQSGTPAKTAIGPAKLRLRTACLIRDKKTLELVRHTRERDTGAAFNTKTLWLRHDEIVLGHIPKYADSEAFVSQGTLNNEDTGFRSGLDGVNTTCDHYIDQSLKQFKANDSQQMEYMGLRPIELDGMIAHVIYSVGPSGAVTIAARNSEILRYTPSFKERRRAERAVKAAEEAKKANTRERSVRAKSDRRMRESKV